MRWTVNVKDISLLPQRMAQDFRVEQESARLEALERYDVLDTPPEAAFDRITRLTKKLYGVPVAIVSFIDGHRQWYKASTGLAINEVAREQTFCQHIIADERPLVVQDATKDPKFQHHPFVVNDPNIRFYAGVPIKTHDGHNIGTLCIVDTVPHDFSSGEIAVMEDLAHVVMEALELRLTANTDSLTGAISRRAFKAEVDHAAALALRHHHDLSVVAFDLDHFKSINDTYGHAAGDAVLKKTVTSCAGQLRNTDLIGRMGGEEFTVLLPNTSQASALQVTEKIRAAVEQQRIVCRDKVIKLTASFGVASFDYNVRDVDTLGPNAPTRRFTPRNPQDVTGVWRTTEKAKERIRRAAAC